MREATRSPSEFYIRYLISKDPYDPVQGDGVPAEEEQDDQDQLVWSPVGIMDHLKGIGLDGISLSYIRNLREEMLPIPPDYDPDDLSHKPTRDWLKKFKIFDIWRRTPAVREAGLILADTYLREKLEPMLLSALHPTAVAKKLRKYTAIGLTADGILAYRHYFWNRTVMSQSGWAEYVSIRFDRNAYIQSLTAPVDMAQQIVPWAVGVSGPARSFNTAEAAARVGQIAFKHALELENRPATLDSTGALRNCMVTIEKADTIMRRSDVALRDVLKQFQKFRMKIDDAKVVDVHELTGGNYSKSGEGTDAIDDDDF